MEASRDLERFRDPVAQQADDLEAAHAQRLAIHERARGMALELPPLPALPDAGSRTASTRSHRRHRSDHEASGRNPQVGPGGGQARAKGAPAEPSTRDTQLVMLAALCQQVNCLAAGGEEGRPARRALDLAERVFDAYQRKQKEDLAELLKRDQPPRRPDLLGAPPGRGSRRGERRAVDGQGRRAGHRVLRIASAPAARRAQRVTPELARDRALSGHGRKLQRADSDSSCSTT